MNATVRMLGRIAIRRRVRGILAVVVIGGLAGAVVLAAAAGARRTSTSLTRFQAASNSADVEITAGRPSEQTLRQFAATPGITAVGRLRQVQLFAGKYNPLQNQDFLEVGAAVDDSFGNTIDRARVIDGRAANGNVADEVTVGEVLARRLQLRVGRVLSLGSLSPLDIKDAIANDTPQQAHGPRVTLRVVGIVRRPLDLAGRGATGGVIALTHAFFVKYGDQIGSFAGDLLRVKTQNGPRDVPTVVDAARRSFGDQGVFSVQDLSTETNGTSDAIDVLTIALWIFAAIGAFAGVVFVGIVANRQIRADADEQPLLAALGIARVDRVLAAAAPVIPMALGAAMLAAAGAIAASLLLPFGIARQADPDPGVYADWLVLSVGALAVALVVGIIGTVSAIRVVRAASMRARSPRPNQSTLVRVSQTAPLSPAGVVGVGFALDSSRGERSTPVRSSIMGAIVGAAGAAAVIVFAASFSHLVSTPALYGWSFDTVVNPVHIDVVKASTECGQVKVPGVVDDPRFSAVAAVCVMSLQVNGRPLSTWSFNSLRGSLEPTVVRGRPPTERDEIALGATTMRGLNVHVGDTVELGDGERHELVRVVGQVVFPTVSQIGAQALADGAVIHPATMRKYRGEESPNPDLTFVTRLAPGATFDQLPHDAKQGKNAGFFAEDRTSSIEVDRIRSIRFLPVLLGALLALLAALAVTHALLLTTRQRRRDLAVLRSMGFTRRQVRATIGWQSTIIGVLGFVVGIPVGILVGGLVWRRVADNLGVSDVVTLAPIALAGVALGALVLVNLIGALASTRAVRERPAAALATE